MRKHLLSKDKRADGLQWFSEYAANCLQLPLESHMVNNIACELLGKTILEFNMGLYKVVARRLCFNMQSRLADIRYLNICEHYY